MTGKRYNIGKLKFDSKKESADYTRDKILSVGCCKIYKEHPSYVFFNNLIKNHPDYFKKVGTGVDYFIIEKNPCNHRLYELYIKTFDNDEEIYFSVGLCCSFKDRVHADDLITLMKHYLLPSKIDFKNNHTDPMCNGCYLFNEQLEDYYVYQTEPSLKVIVEEFLKNNKLDKPLMFYETDFNTFGEFVDADNEFKTEWLKYHSSFCKYELACKSCTRRITNVSFQSQKYY